MAKKQSEFTKVHPAAIRALRVSLTDADEAAVRAMREAAFHLDRSRELSQQLQTLGALSSLRR
ncbi:MAG: hypothetical protein QM696_08670 [Steroidobacteraceae bacterium]